MAIAALREDWLKALTAQAADALGPIADVIVEQAAAEATSFDEVRRRVSAQMEQAARLRFLRATEPLAAEVRRTMAPAKAAAAQPRPPAASRPAAATPDTLDRSDPGFVDSLAGYLTKNLGPDGGALVHEAARRCRTKMQLCMRLANAVSDQGLKDMLLRRALD
ncbi:MAG: hypothetical protein ACREVS_07240 [Burkholderiales bacterium]